MTRVFTTITALLGTLLLASQGADAFLLLPRGLPFGNLVENTIGRSVDTFRNIVDESPLGDLIHQGEGVARDIIHDAASMMGKVTGEFAGGFMELMGLNDTCVGEAAEGCRQVVSDLVKDFLDVGDVELTPKGMIKAIQERVLLQPGTNWCAVGNVTRHHNDRAVLAATDACCQRHKSCPDTIAVGDERHGLRNDDGLTRYNCECDKEFFHCLKQTNTLVSNKVGIIYFNILRPQCFKNTYPAVSCKKRSRTPIPHCAQYVLDPSKEPRWQWFDTPLY